MKTSGMMMVSAAAATAMVLGIGPVTAGAEDPVLVDLSTTRDGRGMWTVDTDGGVQAIGSAPALTVDLEGDRRVVDTEPITGRDGLWVLTDTGDITPAVPTSDARHPDPDAWFPDPNSWIPEPDDWMPVDLEVGPDSRSAWVLLTPTDGSGGGQVFHLERGEATQIPTPERLIPDPNQWFPVDMAAMPDGRGVGIVAADGSVVGIWGTGNVGVWGNGNVGIWGTGNVGFPDPNQWVPVDLEVTPSGRGLWLLGSDGRIETLGDADQYGEVTIPDPNEWVPVGLEPTGTGRGYRVLDSRGVVTGFGDGFVDVKQPGPGLAG